MASQRKKKGGSRRPSHLRQIDSGVARMESTMTEIRGMVAKPGILWLVADGDLRDESFTFTATYVRAKTQEEAAAIGASKILEVYEASEYLLLGSVFVSRVSGTLTKHGPRRVFNVTAIREEDALSPISADVEFARLQCCGGGHSHLPGGHSATCERSVRSA